MTVKSSNPDCVYILPSSYHTISSSTSHTSTSPVFLCVTHSCTRIFFYVNTGIFIRSLNYKRTKAVSIVKKVN